MGKAAWLRTVEGHVTTKLHVLQQQQAYKLGSTSVSGAVLCPQQHRSMAYIILAQHQPDVCDFQPGLCPQYVHCLCLPCAHMHSLEQASPCSL
jgi:hypothetical protein